MARKFSCFYRVKQEAVGMGKRGRALIAGLAIALLGLLAWGLFWGHTYEPVADGKPLGYWLAQLDQGTNYDRSAHDEAESAVRKIGTNAIPILLQMLRVHDSPLKTRSLTWVSEHSFGKIRYTTPSVIKTRAALGFQAIGREAASAVPEVLKILGQAPAFELASHLRIGMREEVAIAYLEQNGLHGGGSLGGSFEWYRFFELSNGCSLALDIGPKAFRPDGAWADGLVRAAYIQCYGANVVSIPLTDAPEQPNP